MIAGLPGIADACAVARDEIDALLWSRPIRARASDVARESALRGSRDSAALDGADVSMALLLDGLDDSPLSRAVVAAIDVTAEVPAQVDTWLRAPLQVLARLHVVAARDFTSDQHLGRPRSDDDVVDPLHIAALPPWEQVPPRLDALAALLTRPTQAPAILVAAITHGELLALRPFAWGSGLIARAGVRLVLSSRGVDPDLLSAPETGMVSLGRSSYVAALRGYISGEPDGVAEWVRWNAAAIGYGAREMATLSSG